MRSVLDRIALLAFGCLIFLALAWVMFHPVIVVGIQIGLALVLVVRRQMGRPRAGATLSLQCRCADPLHQIHPPDACVQEAAADGYCKDCSLFATRSADRLIQVLRLSDQTDYAD